MFFVHIISSCSISLLFISKVLQSGYPAKHCIQHITTHLLFLTMLVSNKCWHYLQELVRRVVPHAGHSLNHRERNNHLMAEIVLKSWSALRMTGSFVILTVRVIVLPCTCLNARKPWFTKIMTGTMSENCVKWSFLNLVHLSSRVVITFSVLSL